MHFPRRFAGVRRITIVGVVTALVVTLSAPGVSAASDPLTDAQSRITAAQEAADKAAAAYDDAQTRYFTLQHDAQLTRSSIASIRATRNALAGTVIQRAVALYMRAGETGFDDVFNSGSNVLDAARRSTLGAAANAHDDAAIGRLRALTEDLDVRQASLRSQLADAKTALDTVRSEQESLQRSLEDARRAEQELRVRLERERRADEYAARVREARAAAPSSGSAPNPSNAPPQIIVSGDWVCPVQGPVSFTSTFGAPRGGHTHKGVDMFAATGTPLVAVVAGSMFFQSDELGGLAAYVTGNDGTTYYYAHLNDYVGGNRSVSTGELIGHVGNTGDASGGASHLHFEIRPGGPNGAAIDPYPTVAAHC
ncbi:MAG TPA: M23 family metallopeptidase [Acidimicrobiia bacterium]|nr:M23 family metallopeptidase [Acidimicrobiia bacterium]